MFSIWMDFAPSPSFLPIVIPIRPLPESDLEIFHYLHSILPLGEMNPLLPLFLGDQGSLILGKPSAQGPCELGS